MESVPNLTTFRTWASPSSGYRQCIHHQAPIWAMICEPMHVPSWFNSNLILHEVRIIVILILDTEALLTGIDLSKVLINAG